jgi:hypothetical protein
MMPPGSAASLARYFLHWVSCRSILGCLVRPRSASAVAGEIDAVSVVDDAVEDGVGVAGMGWNGRALHRGKIACLTHCRARGEYAITDNANSEIVTTIGIDLGKNTFHGYERVRRDCTARDAVAEKARQRLANLTSFLIGMEACAGAHHIGRQLDALGHDVRLTPSFALARSMTKPLSPVVVRKRSGAHTHYRSGILICCALSAVKFARQRA